MPSINLEDYQPEDFKRMDTETLQFIYDSNTAFDATVPCMYESWKLEYIRRELNSRPLPPRKSFFTVLKEFFLWQNC